MKTQRWDHEVTLHELLFVTSKEVSYLCVVIKREVLICTSGSPYNCVVKLAKVRGGAIFAVGLNFCNTKKGEEVPWIKACVDEVTFIFFVVELVGVSFFFRCDNASAIFVEGGVVFCTTLMKRRIRPRCSLRCLSVMPFWVVSMTFAWCSAEIPSPAIVVVVLSVCRW